MKGIRFIVDDNGEKTAVIIDLKENAELWEDFYDALLERERRGEPSESLDAVKERRGNPKKSPARG